MSAIIRRKLTESWREAVAVRFREIAPENTRDGLAAFDGALAKGEGDAEAAFATLSAYGLLWHVEGAGFTPAAPSDSEPPDRHSVPNV
jgi:hypothetical protein